MAFVPDYEHDVFVSYAHVDDILLPGADEGWVTTLVDALEKKLAQKLGRADAFSLWVDRDDLSRHEGVTDQIIGAAQSTATLVVILSPAYVASEWCRRESGTFLGHVRERVRSGTRVFVVERDTLKGEERPPEFGDLKGFRFWVPPSKGRPPRILGTPKPNPNDPRDIAYYDHLEELSIDIAEELKRLKRLAETGDGRAAPAAEPGDSRPAVFLAEVTDDLDPRRDEVKRYLDQAGVRVLPDTLYTLDPSNFREAMERDLAGCALYVQLLSELPGKKWPNLPQGYVRHQYEVAAAADKPMLVWRSPELDVSAVTDEDHRHLLQMETVRAEGIEEFKAEVRKRALEKPQREDDVPTRAFVFVDSEVHDLELANAVSDELARCGVDVAMPITDGTPAEIREDLQRNLAECNAMIVVYGTSTPRWVREQLMQSRRVLYRRDRPLSALAVYQGPPEGKPPLNIRMHNLKLLDCTRGIVREELKSFLNCISPESE